jgi:hypothetical protein
MDRLRKVAWRTPGGRSWRWTPALGYSTNTA